MGVDAKTLAIEAREGNVEAFGDLYALVWRELYRFAFYYLGNREDAEDAVQEAAAEAFRGIHRLRDPEAFKSWMFSITAVCCKRRISGLIRRRAQSPLEELPELCTEENIPEQVETAVRLRSSIAALTPEERAVVLLAMTGGYKSHEIAPILHMTGSGVRSKLSRALKKLRLELDMD